MGAASAAPATMSYGDPIIKICAADNGYCVEVYDPPSKPKGGREGEFVPYEERYKTFVADELDDVLKLVTEWAPKAAKKANPSSEFDYAYKEAMKDEDD